MKGEKNKDVCLQAISMIDPAVGWVEIRSVPEDRTDLVTIQLELAWSAIYPLHNKIDVDRGNEHLAEPKTVMVNDYGIPYNCISTKKPQANVIVKRAHQNIW